MPTDKQGTKPKPLTKAQKTEADKAAAANTADVERSVREWRAMQDAAQGKPPDDLPTNARSHPPEA